MSNFLFGIAVGEWLSGNLEAALVFGVIGLLWMVVAREVE